MTSKFEVRLSESVLTLVTHSAYETGGGFNLVPGGVQCSSANLTDAQRAIVREERKERREKTPWYSPNLQQESTRFLNEKENRVAPLQCKIDEIETPRRRIKAEADEFERRAAIWRPMGCGCRSKTFVAARRVVGLQNTSC